jgi:hypothetical protein
MRLTTHLLAAAAALSLVACASKQTAPSQPERTATPSSPNGRMVKSRDGSYQGEVIGQPRANSRFARLQIGMHMDEVQTVLGRAPDRMHTYESGKRWIPYYFGNDARRMQVLYRGEGCLIFTGGNVWGGGSGDLLTIEHDAGGACYQP